MTERTERPGLTSIGAASGIDVGPFHIQLCGPVVEKVKALDLCGPNIEIKLRDPNELLGALGDVSNQCSPACGVCHPDTCKPGAAGAGTCPPAVMSLGALFEQVVNPVVKHQQEIDRQLERILREIRELQARIPR